MQSNLYFLLHLFFVLILLCFHFFSFVFLALWFCCALFLQRPRRPLGDRVGCGVDVDADVDGAPSALAAAAAATASATHKKIRCGILSSISVDIAWNSRTRRCSQLDSTSGKRENSNWKRSYSNLSSVSVSWRQTRLIRRKRKRKQSFCSKSKILLYIYQICFCFCFFFCCSIVVHFVLNWTRFCAKEWNKYMNNFIWYKKCTYICNNIYIYKYFMNDTLNETRAFSFHFQLL